LGAGVTPVCFCETYDPGRSPPSEQRVVDLTRVRILYALGFQALNFPYVQPALSPAQSPVADLLLLVHTASSNGDGPFPDSDRILRFMGEFYQSLGWENPHASPDFRGIESWLNYRARIDFLQVGDIGRRRQWASRKEETNM